MLIAVNKAHFPVTVLGPGRRIGIWMQGCSIGCPGCISRDTWEADPGRRMPLESLLAWCFEVARAGVDGVTISGGEPFDQPDALHALLSGFCAWRDRETRTLDLLCYSGHPLRALELHHRRILDLLDAIIPEPYLEARPTAHPWRGSANQSLVPLSDLGHQRFDAYVSKPLADTDKKMQVAVEHGKIWMIGIPARGDMEKVEALCSSRGLSLQDVSWRR